MQDPIPLSDDVLQEVREEMAQEEFKFWEAPHLHRRDGSYTNW